MVGRRAGRRSGIGGRPGGGRAVVVAVVALAGVVLTGCADPTGVIDDQGHNGYDAMTCEHAKAFALDVEHGTVFPGTAEQRISDLNDDARKASHPEVQQAAARLVNGYRARNPDALKRATTSLVAACRM